MNFIHQCVLQSRKNQRFLHCKWFKEQDSITESYFDLTPQYCEVYAYYDSLENKEKDSARRIFYNKSGATFYLSRDKDKEYPSTLMIIGFNDYLIPPSGAGKYTALLQSYNIANDKPYLLDVKFDGEHEIDWVEDYAKMLVFTKTELEKRH